ncbi:MAG: flavoprotein [Candidatus Omnitrophota bacterium]|nr:flavoprotein [Candidatus Omnitrophota bacterium]
MTQGQSVASSPAKGKKMQGKTVLHILTGSIAAYKAGDLIKLMREHGARVICVLTEGAKKFITPLTIRAISGEDVYDDFFTSKTPYDVLHTSLAEAADVILVSPASANFIARASIGLADDLGASILLATRCPVILAPAMNDQMYTHPTTQRNIAVLKKIGYHFVDPIRGSLVCGKEAVGHIGDPEVIIDTLQNFVQK